MTTTSKTNQSKLKLILLISAILIPINAIAGRTNNSKLKLKPRKNSSIAFQSSCSLLSSSSKQRPKASIALASPSVYNPSPIKNIFVRTIADCNTKKRLVTSGSRLFAKPDYGGDDNREDSDEQKRSITTARAGGRSTTPKKVKISIGTNENDGGAVGVIQRAISNIVKVIVAVWIVRSLLGILFGFGGGGGSDNPSYVYYQSTVYESRSISSDGKVERIRRESMKSNIPSLISGDRLIETDGSDYNRDDTGSSSSSSSKKSSYLLRDYSDIAIDDDRNK